MCIRDRITNFYDKHTLNCFLVFPIKDEEYTVTLKYGTPLMSIYPMHEMELDIKMHEVESKEKWHTIQHVYPSTFIVRYHSRKHTRSKLMVFHIRWDTFINTCH